MHKITLAQGVLSLRFIRTERPHYKICISINECDIKRVVFWPYKLGKKMCPYLK